MFPEAGSLFAFIVSMWGKMFFQELVGQHTSLGEAPNRTSHFQVNVTVVYLVGKVILLGYLQGEKDERDAHVFVSIKGGCKVQVFISRHIYLALGVLSTLFQCSFMVVISAMRLPLAVIWMWLGSAFWGWWSTTTRAYVTTWSCGILDMSCGDMTYLSCSIVALTHATKIFPKCGHPNFHSIIVVHEARVATD